MTITIELPAELESKVREQASAEGTSAERVVIAALADRFADGGAQTQNGDRSDASESDLLLAISRGPSEAVWRRYHELTGARRAGTLTPDEHAELVRLSDEIEVSHVARLEHVVRLAQLRRVPVECLMADLGLLREPAYD